MADDMLQRNAISRLQLTTEPDQRGNLLLGWPCQTLFPDRIISPAEIPDHWYSQIGVVALGMRSFTPFWSAGLHAAIRQDEVVVSNVVSAALACNLKPTSLVIAINLTRVSWRASLRREHRCV